MNIGIDIDDTIANTFATIDKYAKEYTEKVLKREFKINDIDVTDSMWAKHFYGWTNEEDARFWEEYYVLTCQNTILKPNANKVINRLYQNNKIIVITARADEGEIKEATLNWLKKNNINYHKIYMGQLNKKEIIQENNLDIFIDDNFRNCMEAVKLNIKALMMNARNNKNFNDEKIKRVFSWDEIEKEICG